jgi:ribulose bisphosphate carboxylase small subunit
MNTELWKIQKITKVFGLEEESESVEIHLANGYKIIFWHDQECCEDVHLLEYDDIQAEELVGGLLISVECESTGLGLSELDKKDLQSATWTFYRIRTTKQDITLRFLGSSNGYYSEDVEACLYDYRGTYIGLIATGEKQNE